MEHVEEMRREIMRLRHIVEAMGSSNHKPADEVDDDGRKRKRGDEVQQQQVFTMMSDYCYDASSSEVYMNGIKRPRFISNLQVPTMSGNKAYQVFVRTNDSTDKTLTVRDGYQWRKYGQKVTKDNPSPRAYFRCAMAPTCPAKKKVQRSVEDETFLVVSYEGQHNHDKLSSEAAEVLHLISSPTMIQTPDLNNTNSFTRPSVTLDLSLSSSPITHHYNQFKDHQEKSPSSKSTQSFDSQNLFKKMDEEIIKKYVVSLTKDPNFSTALAMAVARSMPELNG